MKLKRIRWQKVDGRPGIERSQRTFFSTRYNKHYVLELNYNDMTYRIYDPLTGATSVRFSGKRGETPMHSMQNLKRKARVRLEQLGVELGVVIEGR